MARILFIHQNFPAQFRFIAPSLAANGHEVVALGMRAKVEHLPDVRYFAHQIRGSDKANKNSSADLDAHLQRGNSAATALLTLKEQGFYPDIVVAHPGWGEAIFVKDVFPQAKLFVYAEYYYQAEGGDSDFDPEFRPRPVWSDYKVRSE